MKKSVGISCLVLAAVLCGSAFAQDIYPQSQYETDNGAPVLDNCTAYVGFELKNVSEDGIYVDVYSEDCFDIDSVNALAVGDVIYVGGMPVEVASVEKNEGEVLINGGFDADGITMYNSADRGGWTPVEWDLPVYTLTCQVQLPFADQVTVSTYATDEDTNPTGDYDTVAVPAAQVKDELAKFSAAHYDQDTFYPEECSVKIENGQVTELKVDYNP